MPNDPELTKLHIDLPHNRATGGESLWALSLGDDLYEIDNIPFHAYGINCGDVVRATADSPGLKPEIREVVRAGGHRTLRLFIQQLPPAEVLPFLIAVNQRFGTSFEGRDARYYAVDIPPEVDYAALRSHLDDCETRGWLNYETCEARQPGSFDDLPPGSQAAF